MNQQDDIATPPTRRERRLAAVAFLDVVGYGRLVETDEEGTLARWAELRDRIIEPLVGAYRGRIVELLGDGLLLMFQSAVDALAWALAVQRKLAEPAAASDKGPELEVRIAIHVGDVVVEGERIQGDCVNIAARLQEHADPGGIVLSAAVQEQVGAALRYEAADLGPLQLKNIGRAIRGYAVPAPGHRSPRRAPALPSHRPSIAVLPLRSVGPSPVERYFAEGLAHDVVASLAGFRELFVVSSSSTLALPAEGEDAVPTAARALGVRYVVTGTVTRQGDRIRILVEMTDAETRAAIWNDRYDTAAADLFTAQDAAATRIAYSLLPHLRQSELSRARRKPPSSQDAYDLVLQALHLLYALDETKRPLARDLLVRAVERDPGYAMAHALLAHLHVFNVGESSSSDEEHDRCEAARYATRALELDPSDPIALAIYGHAVAFLFGQLDTAMDAFARALASAPNNPIAWGMSSPTYAYLGDAPTAIARAEYALRLSPLDPYAHVFQAFLGFAHFVNGTHEEAVRWSRRGLAANPRYVGVLRHLTASLVALGELREARETAAQLMAIVPSFGISAFLARYPIKDPERRAAYADLLRGAGLPE
ncbi:adenylate/guanylate cyclase domain-containing protein [Elioraea sp.]|uniref:adenylate/guanylate cyclase domain-containing protein n=1 Tax=Elioraea sp. TaxID=2185103 RepID=UPI003F6FCCAA